MQLSCHQVEVTRIDSGLKICEDKGVKIWQSQELIDYIYSHHKNIGVACSFGKDSIVVLHMALQYDKNIPVLFANTGVEFPELLKFKNQLVNEWNLNLIETRPKKSFWKCVEEYGWPEVRNQDTRVPKCCYHLKKVPLKTAYKASNCEVILDGVRAGESRMRFMAASTHGQLFYSREDKVWRAHPILWMTRKEVEDYIKEHKIPKNPLYESGQKRTGCWTCTAYNDWTSLARTHPKLYKIIQKKRNQTLLEQFT